MVYALTIQSVNVNGQRGILASNTKGIWEVKGFRRFKVKSLASFTFTYGVTELCVVYSTVPVLGCCEHRNEPSGFINGSKSPSNLRDHQLLKEDFASYSYIKSANDVAYVDPGISYVYFASLTH